MTLLAVTALPACALGLRQRDGMAGVHGIPVFARSDPRRGSGCGWDICSCERFGRTPLRLGYSLAAAVGAGAVHSERHGARRRRDFPVTRSVATAFGSEPGPTARKMGSFLMLVSFHTTYTASAMFLTGMAANPRLPSSLAKSGTWS